jgi:hypothetical protein
VNSRLTVIAVGEEFGLQFGKSLTSNNNYPLNRLVVLSRFCKTAPHERKRCPTGEAAARPVSMAKKTNRAHYSELKTLFVLYQTEEGNTLLEARLTHDTVWLNQTKMVELFGQERDEHLQGVLGNITWNNRNHYGI